jgi:hypothetical protein
MRSSKMAIRIDNQNTMKKTMIVALILLSAFFVSCVTKEDTRIRKVDEPVITNNHDYEEEINGCETKDYDLGNCYYKIAKREKNFEICDSALEQESKNECLNLYSIDMIYEDQVQIDAKVCDKIKSNIELENKCYESIALKLKDRSYCSYMSDNTKKGCQNKIFYETEGAVWKLTEGFADTGDMGMKYEGNAELKGWLVYEPFYVGKEEAHFKLTDESKMLLPPIFRDRNFALRNVPENIIEGLKDSSNENLKTIKTTGLTLNQEGSPFIEISEIF